MISPSEADALIAASMPRYTQVTLPLSRCHGLALREPIRADRAQPPFDRVAMDGIAFASAAYARGRRRFSIAALQKAGEPRRRLPSEDACIEVMTGCVLPEGADCIAPVEEISVADGYASLSEAYAQKGGAVPYRYVHRAGGDCIAGEILVPAGTVLTAPHLGAAAAFGLTGLSVGEPPAVAIVATGDELVDPAREPLPHQIRRSNPYAIEAALRRRRIERVAMLHVRDEPGRIRRALESALGKCGALILTGGVSMGRTDHVPAVLTELGIKPVFHRIAQTPGKPFWFGIGPSQSPVFALPGNPASVLVCLHRYVLPALQRAMGAAPESFAPERAALEESAEKTSRPPPSRLTQFRPVTARVDAEGRLRARFVPHQGSGDFSAWAKADGFVEAPPETEAAAGSVQDRVFDLRRW